MGPVFGSTDRFEGLGIFFDTYKNNRPGTSFPYVMAMMGDGQTTYDQAHDGKANELAGCSVSLENKQNPIPIELFQLLMVYFLIIGSWSSQRRYPYESPPYLLPGQIAFP